MVAWIQNGERGGIFQWECRGVFIWKATLPTKGLLPAWRRNRIWRKLAHMGVRLGIFSPNLQQEAGKWSIAPVEVVQLRRAMLPELFEKCAIVRTDTVAVRGVETTAEMYTAAAFLTHKARYVSLEVEQGAEQLSDWLRREYGVCTNAKGRSVCGGVTFSGEPRCGEVHLGRECRRYQTVRYQVDGADMPEELVAFLWQAGAVKREQIAIISARGVLDTNP